MSAAHPSLATPVLVKREDAFAWPQDLSMFYLLTRDGLFLCRNHEFFQSCSWVARGPGELAGQESTLHPSYPLIPRGLLEQVVGYFAAVAELHGSEAAVFLAWDRSARRVRVVVPEQEATVSYGWYGAVYAIGLHYVQPAGLPPDWVIFGDVHSHVHMAAYASHTDVADEVHRSGLHIVVGHIDLEPPDFHVEAVVDGARFGLQLEDVAEGYETRSESFPRAWLDKLTVADLTWRPATSSQSTTASRTGDAR